MFHFLLQVFLLKALKLIDTMIGEFQFSKYLGVRGYSQIFLCPLFSTLAGMFFPHEKVKMKNMLVSILVVVGIFMIL